MSRIGHFVSYEYVEAPKKLFPEEILEESEGQRAEEETKTEKELETVGV